MKSLQLYCEAGGSEVDTVLASMKAATIGSLECISPGGARNQTFQEQ